jgi:hypothetical protein
LASGIDSSGNALDKTFAHFRDYVNHKKSNRQAGTVGVFLNAGTLHEFVHQNVVAASIVRQFPGARVYAMYRDGDDRRRFVIDSNPYFHHDIGVSSDSPVTIPFDWFDIGFGAPVKCPEPIWVEKKLKYPDLLLTPRTLSTDAARIRGLAENPPGFRIPPDKAIALDALLTNAVGTKDKWFACISMGHDGGAAVSTDDWNTLAAHIRDILGGLPVFVGPAEKSLPAPEGCIDLRTHPAGFALQVAAVFRARYFLGSDRDWPALASAFRVPAAVIGADGYQTVLWNRGDIVAKSGPLPDIADRQFKRSTDCPGWRQEQPDAPVTPCEVLPIPLPLRDRTLLEVE